MLCRFWETYSEGCGVVLKAPFTTNSSAIRFLKCFRALSRQVAAWFSKFGGNIPYLILQPCLLNRKEYKVVCLGSKPMYIAKITGHDSRKSSDGVNRAFCSCSELKNFASKAVERMEFRRPGVVLSDGLFRVDIMQMQDGRMVVNELEGFEANYDSLCIAEEGYVKSYLRVYYSRKLLALFSEFMRITLDDSAAPH